MEQYLFLYDSGVGAKYEIVEGEDFWCCLKTFALTHPYGMLISINDGRIDWGIYETERL